jgi:hypothetical protein
MNEEVVTPVGVVAVLAAALGIVGCARAKRTPVDLDSCLLAQSEMVGPCQAVSINPHAMDVYPTNPYISSDERLLMIMSIELQGAVPKEALLEAGIAVYGTPVDQAGLNLYRFSDASYAKAAEDVLKKTPEQNRTVHRSDTRVAVAWLRPGSNTTCLARILKHLETPRE